MSHPVVIKGLIKNDIGSWDSLFHSCKYKRLFFITVQGSPISVRPNLFKEPNQGSISGFQAGP